MNSSGACASRGRPFSRCARFTAFLGLIVLAVAVPSNGSRAGEPCADGWWADVMLGSYHIHPYRHFDEFNPGIGVECSVTPQWAASAGYFRNSLDRPAFYAGAVYTPQFAHWRWLRLGAMGGVISGYNFGRFGIGGPNNRTGPVLAPTAITQFGRFGVNFILVPPIPDDNLPFTVGFQAKYRFR
jgi:hypothetical protein